MLRLLTRAIKALVPNDERAIEVLGRRLVCRPRADFHLYRLAFGSAVAPATHEYAAMMSLMGFATRGMVFVDVGANIGLYSAVFASVGAEVGFDVLAIEPHPETARRLRRTLAPWPNATVEQCACSDADGEVDLVETSDSLTPFVRPAATGRGGGSPPGRPARSVRVPARALDGLLAGTDRPVVLKIDAEDHDHEVLAGAAGLLGAGRVRALLVDGYTGKDTQGLDSMGYRLVDARTLAPDPAPYSALFVHAATFPRPPSPTGSGGRGA